MDIADQIASVLNANPKGLKAAEIAKKIGCTRTRVNSFLYSHQEEFEQHDGYIWTVKTVQKITSSTSSPTKQSNIGQTTGVNIFQRVGGTLVSTVTIAPSGNGYSINSTNNQIVCCDCNKFFSIHANVCPFCGCPLHFVADTYFKRYCNNKETEHYGNETLPIQPHPKQSPIDPKPLPVSNFHPKDKETKENHDSLKRLKQIEALPLVIKEYFKQRSIEMQMLSTPTLELIQKRCDNYLRQNCTAPNTVSKQCDDLFRNAIYCQFNCDDNAIDELRELFNKYAKEYVGNKEDFQKTIVDINGAIHVLDVTFFGKMRSSFRKKSEQLFSEAFLHGWRLVDPVKGIQYLAYCKLANIGVHPRYTEEIMHHKDKLLPSAAADAILGDINLDTALLYPVAKISGSDVIVETEELSHQHESNWMFLLVRIFTDSNTITEKRVLGLFCKACDRYYVNHKAFLDLVTSGRVDAKLLTSELAEYDYDENNMFSRFSPESLLRKCGYTVNAQDALVEEKRQKILKSVIDNRLYSPDGIISHLSFLIAMNKKVTSREMKYAIDKWARDITYIRSNYLR